MLPWQIFNIQIIFSMRSNKNILSPTVSEYYFPSQLEENISGPLGLILSPLRGNNAVEMFAFYFNFQGWQTLTRLFSFLHRELKINLSRFSSIYMFKPITDKPRFNFVGMPQGYSNITLWVRKTR